MGLIFILLIGSQAQAQFVAQRVGNRPIEWNTQPIIQPIIMPDYNVLAPLLTQPQKRERQETHCTSNIVGDTVYTDCE